MKFFIFTLGLLSIPCFAAVNCPSHTTLLTTCKADKSRIQEILNGGVASLVVGELAICMTSNDSEFALVVDADMSQNLRDRSYIFELDSNDPGAMYIHGNEALFFLPPEPETENALAILQLLTETDEKPKGIMAYTCEKYSQP